VIGGGREFFSADDAWEKIRAGASLVQVYTGLIYRGVPAWRKRIVTGFGEANEASRDDRIEAGSGGEAG